MAIRFCKVDPKWRICFSQRQKSGSIFSGYNSGPDAVTHINMKPFPKKLIRTCLLLLVFGLSLFPSHRYARAQSSSGDLVSAVNALRAANGLPPYQVDSSLMAFAQQHSEYQASIGEVTHTHIDGSSPEQDGVFENVAEGNNLPADTVVNGIWSDAAHRSTMTGIKAGYIGAGVATAGGITFYTIDVRKEEGFSFTPQIPPTVLPGQNTPIPQTPASTPIPLVKLATSTPHSDGMLVHLVGYGQTLWDIAKAYGVTVEDIQQLNGLSNSTAIYAGQKLLIRLPNPTLAAAASRTSVVQQYTPTLSPTETRTRRPSSTPTRTHTPFPSGTPPTSLPAQITATLNPAAALSPLANQREIGVGLILSCLVGLVLLGWSTLRKK
jgi:uncharacterized protein YkwD/LysM repeat protein